MAWLRYVSEEHADWHGGWRTRFQLNTWPARQGGHGETPQMICSHPAGVDITIPFHIAATVEGNPRSPSMAMFFNGIRATDCEEIVNTVSGRFSADLIGAHGNADDGSNPDGLLGFKGWMNNPRVWATVRSQQQIADNADRQVAADAEGLVSAWDFRETDFTDGGTVPDITGNHNGQWQFRGDGGGSRPPSRSIPTPCPLLPDNGPGITVRRGGGIPGGDPHMLALARARAEPLLLSNGH